MKTAYTIVTREFIDDLAHISWGRNFPIIQLTHSLVDDTAQLYVMIYQADTLPKNGWNGEMDFQIHRHEIRSPYSKNVWNDYSVEFKPLA